MAHREIKVSIRAVGEGESAVERVFAEPNPQRVAIGDTVSWVFTPEAKDRNLRVAFQEVQALGGAKLRDCDAKGPLASLTLDGDRVAAAPGAPPGERFIYKFMAGDDQFPWGNRLDGDQNFGGLDIPQPPPRG